MKTKFPYYYRLSEDEKKQLFHDNDCYYVFDTNALLDIYRLGRASADKVIDLIDKHKEHIVIPSHVATEYHANMMDVITELHSSYKVFLDKNDKNGILETFVNSLNLKKSPSIKRKLQIYVGEALDAFLNEIKDESEYIDEQYKSWKLQSRISTLLGGLVLDGFTPEKIKEIEEEGEERYKKSIPPGYKDGLSKQENKYGDYIIWNEILEFAKSKENCSIIFVTRDLKEDWIERSHGLICGPRLELLEEFGKVSSGKFHICTLDSFITYANMGSNLLNEPELVEIREVVDSYSQNDSSVIANKNSVSEEMSVKKVGLENIEKKCEEIQCAGGINKKKTQLNKD